MDITTLPQEMLANVLKYKEYGSLFKLRKLNSCLNSVIKGYGMIKRIPVVHLSISYGDYEAGEANEEFCIDFYLDSNLSGSGIPMTYRYDYPFNRRNVLEKLAYWGKKVTVTGALHLKKCLRIDESLLSVFDNHREAFKNCKSIWISDLPVDLSISENKELLSIFPELETIILNMYEQECTTLINKEVLGNRKWSHMSINRLLNPLNPEINDDFLLEVTANCKLFEMSAMGITFEGVVASCFTFGGVVNVIKNRISQGGGDVILEGVELGDILYEAIETIVRSIEGVLSVDISEKGVFVYQSFIFYKVSAQLINSLQKLILDIAGLGLAGYCNSFRQHDSIFPVRFVVLADKIFNLL